MVGPRAARARQLARAGVSPAGLVVRLFRCRLGSRLNPFSGFRVNPDSVGLVSIIRKQFFEIPLLENYCSIVEMFEKLIFHMVDVKSNSFLKR